MIYLALVLIAAATLAIMYARKQMRDHMNGTAAAALGREEAQAEYDDARNRIAVWYAGMATGHMGPETLGGPGAYDAMRYQRKEIDRLAERGAWMMDRIRGLDGAQTGPAQRVRHKMELMEAARRQAMRPSERD